MLGLFKKKDDKKGIIKIKVTKTSSQAQYEDNVKNEAKKQAIKCPECGYINENKELNIATILLGYRFDDKTKGFHSKCERCGAEWDVKYRL